MERKHLELELPPPLKASLSPVLKACVYFSSHCPVVVGWPSRAVGLPQVSPGARFRVASHSPAAAASSAHQHPHPGGLFGVWVMDWVPSLCEHPVFHSCSWVWEQLERISDGLGFSCSAQCSHWDKSLWIHTSGPQCLLRDVSFSQKPHFQSPAHTPWNSRYLLDISTSTELF